MNGDGPTMSAASRLPAVTHLDLGCEYRGGQRQVIYLAAEQAGAGMEVRVAAPEGAPILDAALERGIDVLELPRRRDFNPLNLAVLARELPRSSILHTHDARSASLGALAALLRRDLTLVHTRRVSYALGRGWSRWKYSLADLVVCVSREVEEAVRLAGVRRTAVIPSAIVRGRYSPRLAGNDGRLGVIGALSPQKGHAQFFEALALMDDVPEVWIVGAGPLEQPLREQAGRLGLSERVVWKGEVESPLVLPLFDVLVVPSAHGEGSSGVVKEAWASGVPVVCSDLPANLELVRDGENGLVFRNGDPQSLALQLDRLRRDPSLGQRLAAAGAASVGAYDAAGMHAAYLRAYSVALADLAG
jgi:glycosyltransferase involved in cell wall biosynthesis